MCLEDCESAIPGNSGLPGVLGYLSHSDNRSTHQDPKVPTMIVSDKHSTALAFALSCIVASACSETTETGSAEATAPAVVLPAVVSAPVPAVMATVASSSVAPTANSAPAGGPVVPANPENIPNPNLPQETAVPITPQPVTSAGGSTPVAASPSGEGPTPATGVMGAAGMIGAGMAGAEATVPVPEQPPTSLPYNVLFIIADDFGVMDVGAYNPDTFYETPGLDRLAAEGMRFTNGYAANPVCSPTRYSIMTGKYPTRADATDWFGASNVVAFRPAEMNHFMAPQEVTIAEALRENNYRTAFLGKWHLGHNEQEHWPEHQGFDVNVGGFTAGLPPGGFFSPYENPRMSDGPDGEHLPERLTTDALQLMEEMKNDKFFLCLSYYSVHTPLQGKQELVAKYEAKPAPPGETFAPEEQVWPGTRQRRVRIKQDHATYAAMVESMDANINRLLDGLQEKGLADNTVVIFMSDNGGLSTSEGSPTSNLPYRGGKGWLYEGGIREPYMIKVPGVTTPGAVSDVLVTSTDFYPTILALTQTPPKPEQHQDGVNLLPVLAGIAEPERDALFWHYPHYSNQGGFPGGAIRMGGLKLIERYEDGSVHLYDLAADEGEQNDIAGQMPTQTAMMRQRLHAWYQEVDAKFLRARPEGPQAWRP